MDRGGLRLHGNHWSSLLIGNRLLTAMAIICMMANSTWNLATAFSWRHATTAPSYHGLFIFRRECRWSYITWLLFSSGYCWWYTLWKFDSSVSSDLSKFCILGGLYVEIILTTESERATESGLTSWWEGFSSIRGDCFVCPLFAKPTICLKK